MASNPNYKQIFAKKSETERRLREICPEAATHRSGIYFYTREDMDGKKFAYLGKAVDITERTISHINGYQQRIDISLKSRGFYSELNPSGWKLNVLYYPKSELDKWEQYWIDRYRKEGIDLYNVESGGTDGKTIIGERKPSKTYRDGLAQGRKSLARELKHIIDTHLEIKVRKEDNKITQKALAKFWELLESEDKE
jgi:hypothetical protein